MKKLLLITAFIICGSSLIATETDNNERPKLVQNNDAEKICPQICQLSLADFIKGNPYSSLGAVFVLGSLVPAKTKFHVFIGGAIGAAIVLKATDKKFSEALDQSFSGMAEKFNRAKDAIAEKWNDFLTPKKN